MSKAKKSKEPSLSKPQRARGKKEEEFPVKKIRMKVIGIGNGGGAIVADIAKSVKRVKFLVANTDKAALSKLKRRVKTFQFGQEITVGFGAGMDVSLGQLAAEKEVEKIEKILKDCDLCILVACLGGGTGSGAAPVFARISKKFGNLTYGIFTLPFNFEGEKKLEIAKQALKNLEPFVNAITIVPNERIFKVVDEKLPLKKALSAINKILAFNLEGLIEIIYKPGIINIDFADLRTVLKGQGLLSYLGRATAKGEGRAKKVLQKVLSSPIYPYDIARAKRILFNIAGPSNLSISEVSGISRGIFNAGSKSSKIIFGVSHLADLRTIEISLLAVGCEMKSLFPKEKPAGSKAVRRARQNAQPLAGKKQPSTKKRKTPKKRKKKMKQEGEKTKVRKNALQVKKAVEELEKEISKKEEIWETPAFLRRKQ